MHLSLVLMWAALSSHQANQGREHPLWVHTAPFLASLRAHQANSRFVRSSIPSYLLQNWCIVWDSSYSRSPELSDTTRRSLGKDLEVVSLLVEKLYADYNRELLLTSSRKALRSEKKVTVICTSDAMSPDSVQTFNSSTLSRIPEVWRLRTSIDSSST